MIASLLALAVLVTALATGGRGERALDVAREGADNAALAAQGVSGAAFQALDGLGWTVHEVHLQGASQTAQAEILTAVGVRPGQSLTRLDLDAIRSRVEQVGWVEKAKVIRLLPDTLVVSVVQRPLTAIWQHAGRSVVVASNGAPIPIVDPARFPTLPIVVGLGANTAASEILPLLHDHRRLAERVTGLVRIDQRRWDLRLQGGRVILLPEESPALALARLDSLDAASRVLDLDFERIDLRDPRMTVIRPRPPQANASSAEGK
ncbi:MAG TPA: cell division protein FtsQ/DivIB [Caulobacteraceae bacterium]|nr:cell division protein FtsQ/DivIB [Caulobacteraceae bacterium]